MRHLPSPPVAAAVGLTTAIVNSYVEGLLTFASLGLRKKKRDFDGLATTYWNALEEVKMKSRDNSIRTIVSFIDVPVGLCL